MQWEPQSRLMFRAVGLVAIRLMTLAAEGSRKKTQGGGFVAGRHARNPPPRRMPSRVIPAERRFWRTQCNRPAASSNAHGLPDLARRGRMFSISPLKKNQVLKFLLNLVVEAYIRSARKNLMPLVVIKDYARR